MKLKLMTRLLLLAGFLSGFVPVAQAFYNPSTGRWLSRDPLEEASSKNLFAFVSNTPENSIDVLGLFDCVSSCGDQCRWASGEGVGRCVLQCMEAQKNCPEFQKEPCGEVVTRAIDPHAWYLCPLDLLTRVCAPHEFILTADGDGLAFGGNAENADHWTATKQKIYPKVGSSCEDFTKCLKAYFKRKDEEAAEKGKPYKPATNDCRGAVRGALAECGGKLGK